MKETYKMRLAQELAEKQIEKWITSGTVPESNRNIGLIGCYRINMKNTIKSLEMNLRCNILA